MAAADAEGARTGGQPKSGDVQCGGPTLAVELAAAGVATLAATLTHGSAHGLDQPPTVWVARAQGAAADDSNVAVLVVGVRHVQVVVADVRPFTKRAADVVSDHAAIDTMSCATVTAFSGRRGGVCDTGGQSVSVSNQRLARGAQGFCGAGCVATAGLPCAASTGAAHCVGGCGGCGDDDGAEADGDAASGGLSGFSLAIEDGGGAGGGLGDLGDAAVVELATPCALIAHRVAQGAGDAADESRASTGPVSVGVADGGDLIAVDDPSAAGPACAVETLESVLALVGLAADFGAVVVGVVFGREVRALVAGIGLGGFAASVDVDDGVLHGVRSSFRLRLRAAHG